MTAISVADLSLSFGTRVLLDKVSFSLEEGDRLGIIGVNGCGKTTLLGLLCGERQADSGAVYLAKGKTVGYLKQNSALSDDAPNQTVSDRMLSAFPHLLAAEAELHDLEARLPNEPALTDRYTALHEEFVRGGGLEFRSRAKSLLSRLGFSEEDAQKSVALLSGGQKARLGLGIELYREPDILILDEPTNHLDVETMTWLEDYLVSYRKCVLVVSHDRYFLDRVTNKTLSIEYCRAHLYAGGYSASMEQRRIDREIAEHHYENQQKEIARQEAYIAKQRQWNRERNIIAAESRQKMLDKMVKLEKPEAELRSIHMTFTPAIESGNDVLHLRNLSMQFGEKKLFSGLNFLLKKKDRLLVVGPNGCGKSTLIKLILGKLAPASGVAEFGYNVRVGYYDQENQNLDESKTVLAELWDSYPALPETKIRSTLAAFRFYGEDVFQPVSVLSGGERARLTLAKLILSEMNLLVLDEPTNHLDIPSREALEEALSGFEGTIFAVSHDRYFIEKLATRILGFHPGAGIAPDPLDFPISRIGEGYTEYRAFVASRALASQPEENTPASVGAGKEQYLQTKKAQSDARKRQTRIRQRKEEISRLEEELEKISKDLFGDAAADYKKVAALDARKTEIEDRLMTLYEEEEAEPADEV